MPVFPKVALKDTTTGARFQDPAPVTAPASVVPTSGDVAHRSRQQPPSFFGDARLMCFFGRGGGGACAADPVK